MTRSPSKTIAHVIDSLGTVGGAEQQLVQLLSRFRDPRLSHALVCLYETPADASRRHLVPSTVAVHHLFGPGIRRSTRWSNVRRLNSLLRGLDPALIHCSLPNASLAARVVGRLRHIPVVETLVNISHEEVRTEDNPQVTPLKLAFHRWIDRMTMPFVARFQAISPTAARSWMEVVGINRDLIRIIPRGIDLERFQGLSRSAARHDLGAELALAHDAFVLLNLGREQPQKGQRFLLEAMTEITARIPQAVLLLAGSPGLHSRELRQTAEGLGLGNRIVFLGRRADIPRLLAASDVFVFPSLYEGLGVSLLEAMAAGLPVVTTDRPPMSEIVQTGINGLLIPAGDPAALATAVVHLAEDPPTRSRLGEAAKRTVTSQFNIEGVVRQVEGLYLEVLGLETPPT